MRNGCNRVVRVEQYSIHLQSRCQTAYEHSISSPSRSTIKDLLDRGSTAPTTPTERRVASHLIKRLMKESTGGILQVPTGNQGQV